MCMRVCVCVCVDFYTMALYFVCTFHRKLVSKGCWEWCYTSVHFLLKTAASDITKDNIGVSLLRQVALMIFVNADPLQSMQYLLQCLKTITSLLALQPPPIATDLLHLLKPLFTFGMLSVSVSATGPKSSSGDEVSSDEEWGSRPSASSESELSDSEYAMSMDSKSRY